MADIFHHTTVPSVDGKKNTDYKEMSGKVRKFKSQYDVPCIHIELKHLQK